MTIRCAVFNRYVLAHDAAGLAYTLPKGIRQRQRLWRPLVQESYYREVLLRTRRERPCRCAGEERDELAASHSITSSARARNGSGMVNPIALAVLRLRTSSNFVACSTGRSAGFVPFKILSMKYAARQYM